MKRALALAAVVGAAAVIVRAQTFDVASVKQNKSGQDNGFFGGPPSRWTATNVPLRQFIVFAYQLVAFQIEGMPDWAVADRWDISAKSERTFPPNPAGSTPTIPMLRALLEDRFKLVAHMEKRQAPIYELVLARNDKMLGPEMRKSAVDCAALIAANLRGGPPLPQPPPGKILCGITTNTGRMMASGQPVSRLAVQLSQLLQRVVIDRTGLAGMYDFTLTYAPERAPAAGGGAPDSAPAVDPNLPSVFTALQEQLGLKLDPNRGPVDVLVIDHVERPADD